MDIPPVWARRYFRVCCPVEMEAVGWAMSRVLDCCAWMPGICLEMEHEGLPRIGVHFHLARLGAIDRPSIAACLVFQTAGILSRCSRPRLGVPSSSVRGGRVNGRHVEHPHFHRDGSDMIDIQIGTHDADRQSTREPACRTVTRSSCSDTYIQHPICKYPARFHQQHPPAKMLRQCHNYHETNSRYSHTCTTMIRKKKSSH